MDFARRGLYLELIKQKFQDHRFKKSDGSGYDVKFNIMFEPVASMEEAKQIRKNNPLSTGILKERKLRISEDGGSLIPGGAVRGSPGWDSKTKSSHTITHEIFHLIVHYSANTPKDINDGFSVGNQKPWHNNGKYGGGIFYYGSNKKDLSAENIYYGLEHTPTFETDLNKIKPRSIDDAIRVARTIYSFTRKPIRSAARFK